MQLHMMNQNLLIEPGDKKVTLPNGIVMEVGSKSRRDVVFGKVAASFDEREYPLGCTVFFPKYAADDIIVDGKEYIDIHGKDVIMKMVETDEED